MLNIIGFARPCQGFYYAIRRPCIITRNRKESKGMKRDGEKKYFLGLNRNVFYTGVVSLFMDISSEMIYPLLPLFLTNVLGATKTAVGIIEGIAEATASILKVFSGWLSDKLGKRKLLMSAGYGISALSRPLMAIAGSWFHVLGARFIDRVVKGVRTAPRDAIIADSTENSRLGLVVVGVFSLGYFADAFMILQAENLGVRAALIPIIYLAFNVVYAASSTPFGALADRIGLRKMILAGFIFYSVLFVLVAFSSNALHIWILFPLYGIYKGMSEGTLRAYLATLAPAEQKATAFGVYHTVVGLMLLPASIIAGYLWDNVGPQATFLYGSALSAIAALLFVVLKTHRS